MTHRRRTQEGAPHGTFHPAYSQKETHREGWTLAWTCYPDGSETVEIRRLDAGSPLHRATLDLCDPTERKPLRPFCGDWRTEAAAD